MLRQLPSSPPCGMHHCAINEFPNARSVLVCTADDCDLSRLSDLAEWGSDHDQACSWSHVIAVYSRRSDRDQMLIEASPRVNGIPWRYTGWQKNTVHTVYLSESRTSISCDSPSKSRDIRLRPTFLHLFTSFRYWIQLIKPSTIDYACFDLRLCLDIGYQQQW